MRGWVMPSTGLTRSLPALEALMLWRRLLRHKKTAVVAKGLAAPFHGIACRCWACGFTGLIDTLPLDRPYTRQVSRPQIATARLAVTAPE